MEQYFFHTPQDILQIDFAETHFSNALNFRQIRFDREVITHGFYQEAFFHTYEPHIYGTIIFSYLHTIPSFDFNCSIIYFNLFILLFKSKKN